MPNSSKLFERLMGSLNSSIAPNSPPSSPKASPKKNTGDTSDAGAIKQQYGFDPDDPNVTVRVFTGSNLNEVFDQMFKELPTQDKIFDPDDPPPEKTPTEQLADTMGVGYASAHDVEKVLQEVCHELHEASMRHPADWTSPYEGWAIIRKQLDDLWGVVKSGHGYSKAARSEAVQIAATAVRYILELEAGQE